MTRVTFSYRRPIHTTSMSPPPRRVRCTPCFGGYHASCDTLNLSHLLGTHVNFTAESATYPGHAIFDHFKLPSPATHANLADCIGFPSPPQKAKMFKKNKKRITAIAFPDIRRSKYNCDAIRHAAVQTRYVSMGKRAKAAQN